MFKVVEPGKTVSYYSASKTVDGRTVPKTWEEMFENLKYWIAKNNIPADYTPITNLKPREERNEAAASFKKNRGAVLFTERMRIRCRQEKDKILGIYLNQPELLVGKKIRHCVKEEGSEEILWSLGEVLNINKHNNSNPRLTEYIVHYDLDDPDETYRMPLLLDLEKGDVLILN